MPAVASVTIGSSSTSRMQQSRRSARCASARATLRHLHGGAIGDRQPQLDRGADADPARDAGAPPDCAARPSTIERPRPVPLPGALGGEERLGRALQRRLVHAGAGVARPRCRHSRPAPRPGMFAGADRARDRAAIVSVPAARHRVARVEREVEERQFELVGIDADRREIGLETAVAISIVGPSERRSISTMPSTSCATSTASGLSSWRRAKASMRLVSVAPRSAPWIAPSISRWIARIVRQALRAAARDCRAPPSADC